MRTLCQVVSLVFILMLLSESTVECSCSHDCGVVHMSQEEDDELADIQTAAQQWNVAAENQGHESQDTSAGAVQRSAWEERFDRYCAWRERELATNPSPRYLVARMVHTGLGNRLEGLVSAFVTALLTDRVFAVDWAYLDEETTMQRNPTLEPSALRGPGIEWDVARLPALRAFLQSESAGHLKMSKEQRRLAETEDSTLFWSMRGSGNAQKKGQPVREFASADLRARFGRRQLVVLKANKFFGNFLASNPYYEADVARLFGSGVRRLMFPLTLRSLVAPLPQVQAVIDHFTEEHLSGRPVVALQVRVRETYLQRTEFLNAFFESALLVAPEAAVFFVATDHPMVVDRARRALGSTRVCYFNTASETGSVSRLNSALDSVVTDLWLLARADVIITTCGSSFGRVAVALGRGTRLVVSAGENFCRFHEPGTVVQALSREACAYYHFQNWLLEANTKGSGVSRSRIAIERVLCAGV